MTNEDVQAGAPTEIDLTSSSVNIPGLMSLLVQLKAASKANLDFAEYAAKAKLGGIIVMEMPTNDRGTMEVRYVGGKAKVTLTTG